MASPKFIPALSYGFLTPLYDFLALVFGFRKYNDRIISFLDLKAGHRLIDIACGTGSLLVQAKKSFPAVDMYGIDIDEKILKRANKQARRYSLDINFSKTSAANLPFKDNYFDRVVSTLAFHHLPTEVKKQALLEIKRVMKPGSRFLLVDFGKAQKWYIKLGHKIEKLLRLPEAVTIQDNLDGKIPDYLKQSGFKFKEISKPWRGIYFWLAKLN